MVGANFFSTSRQRRFISAVGFNPRWAQILFHVASATIDFSRGVSTHGGRKFFSASRQRRLNSSVADATREYWLTIPWVETPRLKSDRR
jgi:hypothetical protein